MSVHTPFAEDTYAEEPTLDGDGPARYLLRALGDSDWRVRKQAIEVARSLAPSPELLRSLILALELRARRVGTRRKDANARR